MLSSDELEIAKRRFERRLKKYSEIELLALQKHQVYPPKFLLSDDYLFSEKAGIINKDTPVGSMGSCFAREIKDYLQKKEYNYVHYGDGRNSRHGSAPWDRVYNTACMLQEVQRAFDQFSPDLIKVENNKYVDLHRKGVVFDSEMNAEDELVIYKEFAKNAFLNTKVFIFTLGLSEAWYNKKTGKYYAEPPPTSVFRPDIHCFKLIKPEENAENLQRMIDILKSNNPSLEFIFTVSPIPLRATFFNRSVLVSNNVSKSSLVYAAHVVCEEQKLAYYFPSYEVTMQYLEDPFDWDYRHVKPESVEVIMKYFSEMYCT